MTAAQNHWPKQKQNKLKQKKINRTMTNVTPDTRESRWEQQTLNKCLWFWGVPVW